MLKKSFGYSIHIFVLWLFMDSVFYFLSGEPDWFFEALVMAAVSALGAYLGYRAGNIQGRDEGYKKGYNIGHRIGYEEGYYIGFNEAHPSVKPVGENSQ